MEGTIRGKAVFLFQVEESMIFFEYNLPVFGYQETSVEGGAVEIFLVECFSNAGISG